MLGLAYLVGLRLRMSSFCETLSPGKYNITMFSPVVTALCSKVMFLLTNDGLQLGAVPA